MSNHKKRVQCFIDGFNLYHSLHDLNDNSLKWLNLRNLSEAFIKNSQEQLNEVFYFSAFATWIPDSHKRHEAYVKALETSNVATLIGQFKEKQKKCKGCGKKWITHEEKESDVNLALHIVQKAYENQYDKALIITADSDICPAIKMVKNSFPNKEIMVLIPPNRYNITRELRDTVSAQKIKLKHIKNNLFEQEIIMKNGQKIMIPEKYKRK